MYHVLLLILVLYLVCLACFGYRSAAQLREGTIPQQERIVRYCVSLVWNMLSMLAVFLIAAVSPVTMSALGVRPVRLDIADPVRILGLGTLFTAGVLTLLFVYQILAFLISPAFRREQFISLQKRKESGGWYERVVDNLIPRTKREKKWYALSALAAGVSEEIVFRGFTLLLLLESVFPGVSSYALAAAAGFLFGLAHFYQGCHGVIKTSLLGTLFGFLYLGTDSLIFCILLHALFDLSSAFLYDSKTRAGMTGGGI